jgi:hypothetical protein
MSYLAIGAVTKAIAELLAKKLNKPPLMGNSVPKVTTLPPDDIRVDDADGVNLFLYRVATSPFASNVDWRGDKTNPNGSKRPPLALTLHYLLTAYAKTGGVAAQDDITSHQILGNAMAIFHEYPVLNDIHDSDFDASLDSQFAPELRNSFEKIKLSLVPTTMEEFSKIWTGLSKAYRLSVTYDVSLVQIAPTAPTEVAAPPVQRTGLQMQTITAPIITSIKPSSGPAGAQVSLTGAGFKAQGSTTVVRLADLTMEESELASVTAHEIVLNIPEAPQRGPVLPVSVMVNGRESAPLSYLVQPWINSLQPLRGITEIPLVIPFELPPETPVKVEIDGLEVAADFDAESKLVRTTVPAAISTNGPKPVVLLLGSGTPQRSNARFFEVLPSLQSVNVTFEQSPAQTTIVADGERLSGKDVNVRYGALLIKKGENSNPAQVSVAVGRILEADQPVSVIVDGRESNLIPPVLESIDPPEAFRGSVVTLKGRGLSGKTVVVKFGATDVELGSQPFASQLSLMVPPGLNPGPIQVRVSVNGSDTNEAAFKVLS